MIKICFKCKTERPVSDFYAHPQMADGLLGKCKECTKKDVRARYAESREERASYERKRRSTPERREAQVEYQRAARKRNPQKSRARAATRHAIQAGKLVPLPCEVCLSVAVQAHHEDYNKPLDVMWLCFEHHRARHGQLSTGVRANAPCYIAKPF